MDGEDGVVWTGKTVCVDEEEGVVWTRRTVWCGRGGRCGVDGEDGVVWMRRTVGCGGGGLCGIHRHVGYRTVGPGDRWGTFES